MNPLDSISFDEITLTQLELLKTAAYPAGEDIIYLTDLPGLETGQKNWNRPDSEIMDLLREIASFANTRGGYIIIGIETLNGRPVNLPGLKIDDPNAVSNRIDFLLQNFVIPRLHEFRLRWLKSETESQILLIKIPASINPPHLVGNNAWKRYDARNCHGRYLVEDIMLASSSANSRKEAFLYYRQQRVAKAQTGCGAYPFLRDSKLIIHLLPASFNEPPFLLNFDDFPEEIADFSTLIPDVKATVQRNLDGIVASFAKDSEVFSYNQWFENGGFEVVDTCILNPKGNNRIISHSMLESFLIEWLRKSLILLKRFSVSPPYCIMVSLLCVKDLGIDGPTLYFRADNPCRIKRQCILLPPIMIQNNSTAPEKILQPLFDWIWNLSGYSGCPSYDKRGQWIGVERQQIQD